MPDYSWWQVLRVLAGQEPGAADLPSLELPCLEVQPERVTSLLADGVAVVWGVRFNGHMHEPIPAHAWWRIRIELRSSPPFATPGRPIGTVAALPSPVLGEVFASGGWYDLRVPEQELAKLKAAAARLVSSPSIADVGVEQTTAHSTARTAQRPVATGSKFIGYDKQDEEIALRVCKLVDDGTYVSTWAALGAVPDDELPGAGTAESRRKRIHKKIRKAGSD